MNFEHILGLLMLIAGGSAVVDAWLRENNVRYVKLKLIVWSRKIGRNKERLGLRNIAEHFNGLFDVIYGDRHTSLKCIRRSIIISLLSLVIAIFIGNLIDNGILEDIFNEPKTLILMLIANVFADYVSLMETRYVLKFTSRFNGWVVAAGLLVDVIITLFIYVYLGLGLALLIQGEFIWRKPEIITQMLRPMYNFETLTPFMYSTYSTSILFYIFCFSLVAIKFLGQYSNPLSRAIKFVGTSNNPVTSSMSTLAAIVIVVEGVKKLFS